MKYKVWHILAIYLQSALRIMPILLNLNSDWKKINKNNSYNLVKLESIRGS